MPLFRSFYFLKIEWWNQGIRISSRHFLQVNFLSTVLFTFDSTFSIVTVLVTRDFIENFIRYYLSYLSCSRCHTTLFIRLAALFVESHSRSVICEYVREWRDLVVGHSFATGRPVGHSLTQCVPRKISVFLFLFYTNVHVSQIICYRYSSVESINTCWLVN